MSGQNVLDPASERKDFGFRVASEVPEPATLGMLALGGLAVLRCSRMLWVGNSLAVAL